MTRKAPILDASRYLGAVLAVLIADTLTRALSNLGDAGISPLFFAAVLVSAWFGGLGPGLLATVLSGAVTAHYFLPHAGAQGARDVALRVLVFTVVAVLAGLLNAATKRAAEAFRKARDAAEEASAAKTRFLATVSHELRAPLSPVMMIADAMAEDASLPERIRRDAASIVQHVRLQVRLIDDLVDLSRLGSGKLHLHLCPLDLHDPIQAALRCCEIELRDKQIDLVCNLDATQSRMIGDAGRLQQIFWNLVRNAIKFTPERGRITVRTQDDPQGRIMVTVSDTGIGIDPQRLRSIFQAFEQGSPDITVRFGGLGLGLAICQALTEAHGGEISAASEGPGKGAVFTLRLNLAADAESQAAVNMATAQDAIIPSPLRS
jgi:signal transduction histidine kinase